MVCLNGLEETIFLIVSPLFLGMFSVIGNVLNLPPLAVSILDVSLLMIPLWLIKPPISFFYSIPASICFLIGRQIMTGVICPSDFLIFAINGFILSSTISFHRRETTLGALFIGIIIILSYCLAVFIEFSYLTMLGNEVNCNLGLLKLASFLK